MMGIVREPAPVKLFSGMIFQQEEALISAQKKLSEIFGRIDFESRIFPFDSTNYYKKEMGSNLKRKFLSFNRLIPVDSLPRIKIKTNEIEKELSCEASEQRAVNIDPGYLAMEKVVLASTKNFSHRPYISENIYAELTYFYKDNSYRTLDWTYPDYRLPEKIKMFNSMRKKYIEQIGNCSGR